VLADADTTEARIAQLFLEFDTARSGRVPLQVLHWLRRKAGPLPLHWPLPLRRRRRITY
jgi:hypothetical protein